MVISEIQAKLEAIKAEVGDVEVIRPSDIGFIRPFNLEVMNVKSNGMGTYNRVWDDTPDSEVFKAVSI